MGEETRRNPREYFYAEVLQLPPGTRRPDLYTLLGLPFFEADHDTILRAALERIRLLDACQADPRPAYRRMAEALSREVRAAQMTLLDPPRRRVYDAALIGKPDEGETDDTAAGAEAELPPGAMVENRYRVMREVRRGGLGIVYEAMDRNLRSRVHISVLRPGLSHDRTKRRRIENAARKAAALEHPHLVRVDEVGESEGLLFLRTRAIEGDSLLETIEATPHRRLTVAEARRVGGAVAEALHAAHDQGVAHGDLRPHNVFLDAEGRVLVCDFVVSRAVADAAGTAPSRYREPESEPSPAGDLFALGCLLQQMLTGEPPLPDEATRPRAMPDDVPGPLATMVARLLARDPAGRPRDAATVAHALATAGAPRRGRLWIGAAALAVVVVIAGFLGWRSGEDERPRDTVREIAWKLIAQNRFGQAIERLEAARAAQPGDASLVPPLVGAYEGAAREIAGTDPWEAQRLLGKAYELDPAPEREAALAAVRARAVARLAAVGVDAPEVTATPYLAFVPGDVPLASIALDPSVAPDPDDPCRFTPKLDEGRHEFAWTLTDAAGNTRRGNSVIVVDRTPPRLEFVAPEEGAFVREGDLRVEVRVDDEHPLPTVTIRGRPVPLADGAAADDLRLDDGPHEIEVVARDRAGLETRATRSVTVDSRPPALSVEAERIVTRGGSVVIRGRVGERAESVVVDGHVVAVGEDGTFARAVDVAADRRVPVEATSPTGYKRRKSVALVVDAEPPVVTAEWGRRGGNGALLYGAKEMDARRLEVRLSVEDKTRVTLFPGEGKIEEPATWRLDPREGRRTVRLRAVDEAGRETTLELVLEGHRATPRLEVECSADEYTRDDDVVLEIDADTRVEVIGEQREPGRIRLPLAEGRHELVVRAVDRYGNETRWAKSVTVDRTPPEIRLVGDVQRGIGRQELVFEANEPIASLTCFARTWEVEGTRVRVEATLKAGRRNLTVRAKDLAGNTARVTLPLRVRNRVLALDGKSAAEVALPRQLDEFTVECWVRGEVPQGTSVVFATGFLGEGFALFWSSSQSRVPYAEWYAETSGRLALSVRKTWKWEEWTHVALCFDGKRMRLFVDGSQQGMMEIAEKVKASRTGLFIGAQPGGTNGFRGAIDELRVSKVCRYTRGFSPAKFLKEDEDTLVLLRFDTREGDTFPDASPGARHASAIGGASLVEEDR